MLIYVSAVLVHVCIHILWVLCCDFQSISDVFSGLMQAVGASEKVFEYIDRKPEIALNDGTLALDRLGGRIEFRNVSFSYPGRPNALVLKVVRVLYAMCFMSFPSQKFVDLN